MISGNELGEFVELTNELAKKDKSAAAFLIDVFTPGGMTTPNVSENITIPPIANDLMPGALSHVVANVRGVELES